MKAAVVALLSMLLVCAPAAAKKQDPNALPFQFGPKDKIEIKPDRAYILFRARQLLGFRFLRIPDSLSANPAKAAFEPRNIVDAAGWMNIGKSGPTGVILVAVPSGTYWLYGEKTKYHLSGPPTVLNCLCMGTIKFEARAGTITDLGEIHQLYTETKNGKQPDATGRTVTFLNNREVRGIKVEPFKTGEFMPAALASFPREPANYSAAGFLPNIEGTAIDRISAMPGVIAYDRDRIIDLKAR